MIRDDKILTLLVVECNDRWQLLLSKFDDFSQGTVNSRVINDPHSALELVGQHSFDCVLLSYQLITDSGLDVEKIICSFVDYLPVILLCRLHEEKKLQALPEREFCDYLLVDAINTCCFVLAIRSAKAQYSANKRLRQYDVRNRLLTNAITQAFVCLDSMGTIVEWNAAASEMFGLTSQQAIGKIFSDIVISSSYRKCHQDGLEEILNSKTGEEFKRSFNTFALHSDGDEFPIELVLQTHHINGVIFANAFINNIGEGTETEKKLRYLSYHDSLTNLANRRLFQETLAKAISRMDRSTGQLGILFLDIDHFKTINDTLGHDAGDIVLNESAKRLLQCVRKSDLVGRLGGDEFTILVEDMSQMDDATHIAEKILKSLNAPIRVMEQDINITTSIGIAVYPHCQCGNTVQSLLKSADIAMYQSKQLGRNQFQHFSSDLQIKATRKAHLIEGMRQALKNDEFIIYYQPQVRATGEIVSVEALLRWHHPVLGLLSPHDFIPVAEETGQINLIGDWVVKKSCDQLRAWHSIELLKNIRMTISINLSTCQLKNWNLASRIFKILEVNNVNPNLIELEITESTLLEDDRCLDTLKGLYKKGVRMSIDDFGTGYSSLRYLQVLPIQSLKIDKSFINNVCKNSNDAVVVKATIALAKALNLEVAAEGVETEEQFEFLKEQQCDYFQGYLFCKPYPVPEMTDYLIAANAVDRS